MEPIAQSLSHETTLRFNIYVKVKRIWQHFSKAHAGGVGPDALFNKIDCGWYVAFDGSYEALFFGMSPPPWAEGDEIRITFQKVT